MLPRSYKKNIVDGKNILIFSILFAVIIRLIYYFFCDHNALIPSSKSYLWEFQSIVIESPLYSIIASSIFVALIAIMLTHLNTQYTLIRRKTLLPPAMFIFIFSIHPSFMVISQGYVGALTITFLISTLLSSYNDPYKQVIAAKSGFALALGSLFAPAMLLYIPVLWIGFTIMRHFNIKSLIASLFGIIIVYIPAFCFYLYYEELDRFYQPFVSVSNLSLTELPSLHFSPIDWVSFLLPTTLLSIIISNNYINRHKDKIKTRAYLSTLNTITLFGAVLSLSLEIGYEVNLYVSLTALSLLLSHFFALAETKKTAILFYLSLIASLLVCLYSFIVIR